MKDNASFIGRGWSFPPRFNSKMNQLELVEGEEEIRESLVLLFSTRLGERLTNPEFGCAIHDLILDTLNTSLKREIEKVIRHAVLIYEPRIDIESINIEADEPEGIVYVGMEYLIRTVNVRTNIVYPFYKLEGTELTDLG